MDAANLFSQLAEWENGHQTADILPDGFDEKMAQTPQDPAWHGEGDVWTHTCMVCEALVNLDEYRKMDTDSRRILLLAALLHDIGKIRATRMENNRLISPGHARLSAQLAREILWRDYGLCGTQWKQQLREAVCQLVQYHSLPPHAIDQPDGKLRLMRAASNGKLVRGMTVRMLCTLAKADILGRICPDRNELLGQVELCRELALEAECLDEPYPFPTDHTAFTFLNGQNSVADYPAYDSNWGEVVLMSGLPGTGKDTWIGQHLSEMPVVSLDRIRAERKISPSDDQGRVVQLAIEEAKQFLRSKTPFVWNATNLSPMIRSRLVGLVTGYGGRVRIVYLETEWEEQLCRNRQRQESVPEKAIIHMLKTIAPPQAFEAHQVDWFTV